MPPVLPTLGHLGSSKHTRLFLGCVFPHPLCLLIHHVHQGTSLRLTRASPPHYNSCSTQQLLFRLVLGLLDGPRTCLAPWAVSATSQCRAQPTEAVGVNGAGVRSSPGTFLISLPRTAYNHTSFLRTSMGFQGLRTLHEGCLCLPPLLSITPTSSGVSILQKLSLSA